MLKELSIEIIRKCPNCCIYCSSMSNEHCNESISFDKYKDVINSAIEIGASSVCLSGGEPFLHPDIVRMVDYSFRKGLIVYIYTSGIVFDSNGNRNPIADTVLQHMSGKIAKLIFNIESANIDTYNKIMGTMNCFPHLISSVQQAHRHKIKIEAHFVPMKLNINDIDFTVKFCRNMGIEKISFLRLVLHGRAEQNNKNLSLNTEETEELKQRLKCIANNESGLIRIGVPLSGGGEKRRCEAANGKLNIRYDGLVFACEVFKNNKVTLNKMEISPPSIYDKSIREIYENSEYMKSIRESLNKFKNEEFTCENCIGQYYMNKENWRMR